MPHMTLRELDSDDKPTEAMVLDISVEDVKALKIGQEIEVTIKGSVGMLSVPPDGVSEHAPPELGIRVASKTIQGKNVFADLAEDEDDEED